MQLSECVTSRFPFTGLMSASNHFNLFHQLEAICSNACNKVLDVKPLIPLFTRNMPIVQPILNYVKTDWTGLNEFWAAMQKYHN